MKDVKDSIHKHIRQVFPTIKTQEELLSLINYIHSELNANHFTALGKPVPLIRLKTLTYYKDPKLAGAHRYVTFTIKKKSGKDRIISAPAKGLKLIQRCLNEIFQSYYTPNDSACGFIPNRNITDGAKIHTNMPYVFNIDLKDFFDTITFPRVKAVLSLPPFNLKEEREPIAFLLTSLCCHPKEVTITDKDGVEVKEIRNCLPQGAPTSPILTNIVCRSLDRHLAGLARRFKAHYSRYADDITFSCNYNIFKKDTDFIKELYRIIEDEQHFVINPTKTRMQAEYQKQEVTGVIVNRRVNVTQRYAKQLRLWLHYWECFGYERAQQYFSQQYVAECGYTKKNAAQSHIENVIAGKLDYMRMVVGEANPAYKKLKLRFDCLISGNPVENNTTQHTSKADAHTAKPQHPYKGNNVSGKQVSKGLSEDINSLLDDLINNI